MVKKSAISPGSGIKSTSLVKLNTISTGKCLHRLKGHKQGPVGVGKDHFYRFYITYRVCEPVMYETDNAMQDFRQPNQMVWKVKRRNYYRKGDCILYGQIAQKDIPTRYRTLAYPKGSKTLFQNLIDSEILGPSPMYNTAMVIWDIKPARNVPGAGVIDLKPVLYFGKTAIILVDEPNRSYCHIRLSKWLPFHKMGNTWLTMLPFLYGVMEIMQIVITGLAKAAVSRSVALFVVRKGAVSAATTLAEKQLKRALVKTMGKEMVVASAKSSYAFVVAFLAKMTDRQEELLRKMAEKSSKIDYGVFDTAINSGIQAFVTTFIDHCLGSLLGSYAKQAGLTNSIKLYLVNKLTGLKTSIVNSLVSAYRNALEDQQRKKLGKKPPKDLVQKYMVTEFNKWFTDTMKGLIKDLTSHVA